jgi:hypothetical protein
MSDSGDMLTLDTLLCTVVLNQLSVLPHVLVEHLL